MLMEYLKDNPRNYYTVERYLGVSNRTVYRYLKLYEALGYIVSRDKFNKIQLLK